MYWTLHILWKLARELKTCVSFTLRGRQLWISLSRCSSHRAWVPVCRIKHAEHLEGSRRNGRKAVEMSQRTCGKNPGEFAGHVGRKCRFPSQDLFSRLQVAAVCAGTLVHVSPKQFSWPRKASLALPVATNIAKPVFYSLINHLSPEMRFVGVFDFHLAFWLTNH